MAESKPPQVDELGLPHLISAPATSTGDICHRAGAAPDPESLDPAMYPSTESDGNLNLNPGAYSPSNMDDCVRLAQVCSKFSEKLEKQTASYSEISAFAALITGSPRFFKIAASRIPALENPVGASESNNASIKSLLRGTIQARYLQYGQKYAMGIPYPSTELQGPPDEDHQYLHNWRASVEYEARRLMKTGHFEALEGLRMIVQGCYNIAGRKSANLPHLRIAS